MMQNIDVNLAIALNLTARSYSQLIFKTTCSPSSYSAEDGEGTTQDKEGFVPGGAEDLLIPGKLGCPLIIYCLLY
jgi:hypothetical protein